MQPVPHLAARSIASATLLGDMLGTLHREAGVDRALLVAGSARTPLGRLDSSLPALASGLFERCGFRALGVADHPEGSPDIAAETLALALHEKNRCAQGSPLRMHLVTQFCFDGAPMLAWEKQIRAAGNRLPVHVGLAGLASLPTLVKYAQLRCWRLARRAHAADGPHVQADVRRDARPARHGAGGGLHRR